MCISRRKPSEHFNLEGPLGRSRLGACQHPSEAKSLVESIRPLQNGTFLIDLIDAQAADVLHFEILEEALDGLPDAIELLLAREPPTAMITPRRSRFGSNRGW